jgi:hypothetical protein
MPTELDPTNPNPTPETKTYSDEEIAKILNTAKATREERKAIEDKAKQLEEQNKNLSSELEKIKTIDPKRYSELENLAKTYEERKLEEQRQFSELKERWGTEKTTLQQQVTQLQEQLKQTQVVNTLEKAFYATGGKSGKDEDGYTYFDLVVDRAMKFIRTGEDGKLQVVDPRDGLKMTTEKGTPFTIEDLMFKLRNAGPTAALFEPQGNGAGGGMQRNSQSGGMQATRDQLMQIKNPAARLAEARRLGIK